MAMTMTEKILAAHAGLDQVVPGDLILAKTDMVLGNDITTPVAIREFQKCATKVFDPNKITIVLDHFTPNKDIKSAEQSALCRTFAKEQDITHFFDVGEMGIEHALLPEKGLVRAGELIIGADSHTCTYGALNAFSTGVGSTDMACAMATGKVWLRVPKTIRITLTGTLNKWVSGKDIILSIIGMIGVEGARYQAMEFAGDGVSSLSMDSRLTICNMAIEAGAKCAIFPYDAITDAYLKEHAKPPYASVVPDADAHYDREIAIDLAIIKPTISLPHSPDNTIAVDELKERIVVDQVVIGSCTNGRLEDLQIAAGILKGKHVAKGVRVIVFPATQQIYLDALKEGYIEALVEAGCSVSTPTCGPCLGGHMGILAKGEKCVATTNRNFVGRMGHVESKVYLASPAVAAASALLGYIASPEALEG